MTHHVSIAIPLLAECLTLTKLISQRLKLVTSSKNTLLTIIFRPLQKTPNMDFIEGIGEQYLKRKAFAVPQQAENLVKKQLSSATDTKKQVEQASTLASEEKDQEIAKLRKQLAETKLDRGKAIGEAKASKSEKIKSTPGARGSASKSDSRTSTTSPFETNHSGTKGKEEARLKKGLVPLSIDALPVSKSAKDTKGSEAGRGRRSSVSTATATEPHRKTSSIKGGGSSSKPGNEKGGLRGLEALGALPDKAKDHKAAAAAEASERGSSRSTTRASSHGGLSTSRASEIGSECGSTRAVVAPRPPLPPPMHQLSPRREAVYAEEIRHYEREEPEMYIVEVEEEEETPRRKKSVRRRGGGGDPGIVEVSSSKGRTVYRVT